MNGRGKILKQTWKSLRATMQVQWAKTVSAHFWRICNK
jgi:hypothetical protein